MNPISVTASDGERIEIRVDNSGARPAIHISDPHEDAEHRVEVFINGIDYSPDSF